MSFDQLASINWQESLRLAGNNPHLANDLMARLIQTLPHESQTIRTLLKEQKIPDLIRHVHKIRGGLAYTGLTRLKAITSTLESDLKNNIMGSLASLISQFDNEVCLLLDHVTHPPAATADEVATPTCSNSYEIET